MSTVADKLAKKSSHKTSAKQVRLRLVYVDFWSAVKLSFLAAIAIAIVTVVSFVMIYLVVSTTGLISKADDFFGGFSDGSFMLSQFVSLPQVLAFSAIVAILNLVVDHGARRRHRGHLQPRREGDRRTPGRFHLELTSSGPPIDPIAEGLG